MKEINISLKGDELLMCIDEVTFIVSDAMPTTDNKAKSSVQDATQNGRLGRIITCLNKSWGEILNATTAYTKNTLVENLVISNSYKSPSSYNITLKMPDDFTANNTEIVKDAMQSYMINRTLFYWFSMVKKDEAQLYEIMSQDDIISIKRYLNKRVNTHNVKMSIF